MSMEASVSGTAPAQVDMPGAAYVEHPIVPRLDLNQTRDIRRETTAHHMNRYELAASHVVEGCVAVDVCCGTGYGTEILRAAGAGQAIGVDISAETVNRAAADYPFCTFVRDSAPRFFGRDDLPANPGVVTFFEAIEHMERPDGTAVLDGVRMALNEEGTLLLSTPRDIRADVNPDHVTQWTPEELEAELSDRFNSVDLFGQDWATGQFTAGVLRSASFYIARCTDPIR